MDWLNGLVRKTSTKKISGARPKRRPSGGRRRASRGSNKRDASNRRGASKPKQQTRYYVKKSDNRVVTAYKTENGAGYVYRKRTPNGTRNIPVRGTTYKTEAQAKKKAEANRKK